jgi:hypothetical protein
LLDIVFRKKNPPLKKNLPRLDYEKGFVTEADLALLAAMVEIEFASSMEKEISSDSERLASHIPEPLPYDVWVMEPSLCRQNLTIAVCVPTKNGALMWLYENGTLYRIHSCSRTYKIASLSGVARVLQALRSSNVPPLMLDAMNRTSLKTPPQNTEPSRLEGNAEGVADSRLNPSQQRAVNFLEHKNFTEGLFAIQGPPGCGKTSTMVGMIEKIRTLQEKMIVSAPSNAAVANIVLKLFENHTYDHRELCVFGANCDESVRFLNPEHRAIQFYKHCKKINDLAEDEEAKSKERTRFLAWLHARDGTSADDIACLCNEEQTRCLSSAVAVFCTLNSAGSGFLQKWAGERSTFLLDEAGQCSEAEFYIATQFRNIKRIVVMGDPEQLPPTVIDTFCKKTGFGRSWLGNVQQAMPTAIHLLNTQYRMDPKILAFPNCSFYGGHIQSGESVMARAPAVEHPFRFVDSRGRGAEEREKYSWRNAYEAVMIKTLLRKDSDIRKLLARDPSARVVIITPYQGEQQERKNH